jgi:ABC-type bacteriocin/lantibiotic exporter with double-glycine peptidase domain
VEVRFSLIFHFIHCFLGGKTTCIGLLEHFYEADEGEVLIDGIPVKNYDYKFYHQKVINRF